MSAAVAAKGNTSKLRTPKATSESKGKGTGADAVKEMVRKPSWIASDISNYAELLAVCANQLAGARAVFEPFTDNNDPLPSHLVWAVRSIIELAEDNLREAQEFIGEKIEAVRMGLMNPDAEAALQAAMDTAHDASVRLGWHERRQQLDDTRRLAEYVAKNGGKPASLAMAGEGGPRKAAQG